MEILLQTKVFSPLSSTARTSAVHTVCSCNCLAQRLRRVNTCLRCARYNTSVRSVLPCAQAHTAPPPSAGSCACSITILMSRHMSHCRETLPPELTSEFCRNDALLEVRTRHPRHRKSHDGSRTNSTRPCAGIDVAFAAGSTTEETPKSKRFRRALSGSLNPHWREPSPTTNRSGARVRRRPGPPAGSRPGGSPASRPRRRTARSGRIARAGSRKAAAPPKS